MIVKQRIKSGKQALMLMFLVVFGTTSADLATAGLDDLPIGARSLAMGAAYVGIANTADAVFHNPGGLARMSGIETALFYQEPFGLDDIRFGSLSLTLPLWSYRVGIGISYLGLDVYKEQNFAAAFSHHYRNKLYFGVGVTYQTLSITGYGSTGTFGLDVGVLAALTPNLNLGLQTRNINRASIGQSGDTQPQILKTGLSFQPHAKLLVAFEIFKDVRFPQEFRFGTEFKPVKGLALRAGIASNPDRFSSGFGIEKSIFKIDYAFFTHNDLGLTHQLSFSIHWSKSRAEPQRPIAGVSQPPTQKVERPELRVNLNQASAQELQTLPGIGPVLAEAILTYRRENGDFATIEALQNIPGIGPKTFDKIKDKIYVEPTE